MATGETEALPDRIVSFRMPVALLDDLRKVAEANDRSLSAEARLALKHWLEVANNYDGRAA